jgi:hypothetical protein
MKNNRQPLWLMYADMQPQTSNQQSTSQCIQITGEQKPIVIVKVGSSKCVVCMRAQKPIHGTNGTPSMSREDSRETINTDDGQPPGQPTPTARTSLGLKVCLSSAYML